MKLIGTAGHVDHGKTTLIKALTGIDADRLPEEKARGMTIDVGYAYIDLPGHGRVSIVDVPGHERFLTNMLVGALGINVALLCVASDESVMPQTIEHFRILELLPVEKLVVAMTRADLADAETKELVREEIEELLTKTRFKDSCILEVSAITNEGLKELRAELANSISTASAPTPAPSTPSPWYLPIDRTFSIKGHGAVVTGTLAQGEVRVGDRAFLEPGHREVRVRGIHEHGDSADHSERGRRTALNLSGISLEDLDRGMALGAPGALFETEMIDARLRWVEEPKHGERVRVSIGADEVIGKAFLNDKDPNLVQLRLERPAACALDQPLIVRRYSPPLLLAGGKVTVPVAKIRRKKEDAQVIEQTNMAEAVLQAVGNEPNGVPTDEICRRLGKTPQALGDIFEQLQARRKIRSFAGLWMTPEGYELGVDLFMAALDENHKKTPGAAGIPRERVVHTAALKWAGKPLDRIVADLAAEGRITVAGTTVRNTAFSPQLPTRQREFLDRVIEVLERETVAVPSAPEIARQVVAPAQAVAEILQLGIRAGEIVHAGEQSFYTPRQIEAIKVRLKAALGTAHFSATEAKDALETSRKYIIPILEHLDSKGFTMRLGDNRIIKG